MDAAEFRRRGKEMVDYIADYLETVHTRRVTPEIYPGYLRHHLPKTAPSKPEKWDTIMGDVERFILPGMTHWQHPRFHAYFPAGNSYPAILGDMLSDGLGCVGFSWAASPACTELEVIVLDWMAGMMGLPQKFLHSSGIGGGVIQGTASESILISLIVARREKIASMRSGIGSPLNPVAEDGYLVSKLVCYSSRLANACVEKATMLAMVKHRQLDVDDNFCLRGQAVAEAIKEDRKMGLIPFFVCVTFGTTACCSMDSLYEIAQVCQRENIWLHVDAAYAGSMFICPEYQHWLRGIEVAQSFNVNPNKWMLTCFDCSLLWIGDKKMFTRALTVDTLYLRHSQETNTNTADFRHWGIALSRRFRSLKLWFVLRSYGCEGLQAYIKNHIILAKRFQSLVAADPHFETIGKVHCGLVCLRLVGHNTSNQLLLRAINMSGKLHLIPALVNDKYIIRFCVCAPNACDDDINYAWKVIQEIGAMVLRHEMNGGTHYPKNITENQNTSDPTCDVCNLQGDQTINEVDDNNDSDEDIFFDDVDPERRRSHVYCAEQFRHFRELPEEEVNNEGPEESQEAKVDEQRERGQSVHYTGANRNRRMLVRMISDPQMYNKHLWRAAVLKNQIINRHDSHPEENQNGDPQ